MKIIYFTCIVLLVILISFCGRLTKDDDHDFNIILITVDALRADHLSTYGYKYQTSPNIDEFADKSIVFEYAYCPIPKTSASFASLMTGLHPFIHKTRPNRDILKEKYITLAEVLKLKGYHNFAVVDNGNLSHKFKFHQGFDQYIEVWNETEGKKESSPYITKATIDFLMENEKKPFFLWAHYIETHSPYLPPSQFIEDRPKGRKIKNIDQKIIAGERKHMDKNSHEGDFLSLYDAAVKFTDSEVGKILDLIFKRGYDEDSIIIISADHGEDLGEYNYFYNHGPLTFQHSIRVPLIMYIPGENSRRIRYPVSLMDIYPTILDKLGLSLPYEVQGINLLEKPKQRFLYIIGPNATRSVVYENYHLIKVEPRMSDKLNLENVYFFDIYKDPYETENISDVKKDLQDLMDKKYLEFFNRHGYFKGMKEGEQKPVLTEREIERLKALGYINKKNR